MKLLIDAGNSHIKWASLEGNALSPMETGTLDVDADRILPATIFGLSRPELVVVSNVAGHRVAQAIRDEAKRHYDIDARFAVAEKQAFGVRNAYAEPAKLGADRWAAMIGAFTELGGPVCVVDAGTAFTVDVVAGDGLHLGGLIAPGLELMVKSLRDRTSDIVALENAQTVNESGMLADNTADALRNGALNALAGMVERAIAQAEALLDQETRVVVTGGDAGRIRAALRRPATYNPALVLQGLAEFAKA